MAEAVVSSSSSSESNTRPASPTIGATDSSVDKLVPDIAVEGPQGKDVEVQGASGGELENKIDKLLQKQRNELMYELRRLQHGDRPVTGQGNKEAVEQFFQRASGQTDDTAETQQQRPESVVVEVNALVERRPVSQMLHSSRFRRTLETALRGALSNIGSRSGGQGRTQRSSGNVQGQERSGSVPTPPPVAGLAEFAASRDTTQTVHQPPPVQSLREPVTEERVLPTPPAPTPQRVVPAVNVPSQPRVAHAQQWLQQIHQHGNDSPDVNAWDRLEESQRQEFIEEISELVQRQLVTATLEGNFRNVLETRMRDRLEQSGTDGHHVQQVLRSLPPSHHTRNDFSDLGIVGPGQQDLNSDEVSVISATAAVTVPYAQSNAALSRELASLKAQMKEMMAMMKVNLDMTMDVQRSVRQEVAAAMNNYAGQGATGHTVRSTPVNDTTCLICTESQVDTVLYQCGHMCVCHGCGVQLRQRGAHCPVCRAPIRDIIRAYKCNSH